MIRLLREFCEDNNQAPPAPMLAVAVRPELSYWSGSDPALENEADPAVEMVGPSGRAVYLQQIIYELRYLLLLENGDEFERGTIPDLLTALELARTWFGGGGMDELPKQRRPVL